MRGRYDAETKAKAVGLYIEHVGDYGSPWAAMRAISARLGMTAETLRRWVRQCEVDAGQKAGLSAESVQELRELRRKCRELEQTIEVLKAATGFMSIGRLCGAGVRAGRVRAAHGQPGTADSSA